MTLPGPASLCGCGHELYAHEDTWCWGCMNTCMLLPDIVNGLPVRRSHPEAANVV
jgi:hypothetical protein